MEPVPFESCAASAPTAERRQRARFDALRRQMFGEMGQVAARWRLMWIVPFNAFVIALLLMRGDSMVRVGVQSGALLVSAASFFVRQRQRRTEAVALTNLMIGGLCHLIAVANTGGIASPLLVTGVPILVAAAMQPMRVRERAIVFSFFLGSYLALALASRTALGVLVAPLTPSNGYSSPEYVVIAAGALVLTSMGIYTMGERISDIYARVAFELAARREELCAENEDRTRALEGIAARLAHEVKNPLAAIKGLSTHMARSATDPKAAERLAIVAAEADRLQAIVDGFLSFSRGLDDLNVAPMKPWEVAHELTILLETRAADSGVKLEVKGATDLSLNADARKLRQALLNLVLNAMQASPQGETVTMEIAKCCGGAACIKVIDRGAGMTPEVLERIRRPYFTTREGGTGLGIAVARGLIEQHGGQLHYDSRPGRGTTVTIDMPACAYGMAEQQRLPNPVRAAAPAAATARAPAGGEPAS